MESVDRLEIICATEPSELLTAELADFDLVDDGKSDSNILDISTPKA